MTKIHSVYLIAEDPFIETQFKEGIDLLVNFFEELYLEPVFIFRNPPPNFNQCRFLSNEKPFEKFYQENLSEPRRPFLIMFPPFFIGYDYQPLLESPSPAVGIGYSAKPNSAPQLAVQTHWEHSQDTVDSIISRGILSLTAEAIQQFDLRKHHAISPSIFSKIPLDPIPFGGASLSGSTLETLCKKMLSWHKDLRPCLFLDRDGVIIEDVGYPSKQEHLHILPGILPIIQRANRENYRVVVVTNQSGIARGFFTEETYREFTRILRTDLEHRGAFLDAIYHCPFHPDGIIPEFTAQSILRKPFPGMVLKAMDDFPICLAGSYMIGDKASDHLQLPSLQTLLLCQGTDQQNLRHFTDHQEIDTVLETV